VDRAFNELVNETIIAHEEKRLISETPEIRYLLQEYHDGILLFEIMDQKVWSRSTHDEEGLNLFFQNNIQNYSWDKKVYIKEFSSPNQKTLQKAKKFIISKKGKNATDEALIKRYINKGDTLLTIKSTSLLPEDDQLNGYKDWDNNISNIALNGGQYHFTQYIRTVENDPKSLNEIRGQVISDYQEFIEKEWVTELKSKHPIKIYQDVYEKIVSNLN
jgi:peptidyl-prolyl cis-trans isomerase SurA